MDELTITMMSWLGGVIIGAILGVLEIISGVTYGISVVIMAIVLCVLMCTVIPWIERRKINACSLKGLFAARDGYGKLPSLKETKKREKGVE